MRTLRCLQCVLATVAGALAVSPAQAQRHVTLVDWNQSWQYVEQFGLELGTAWRTNTYNDAVAPWLTGQGIFADETAVYPAPFLTALSRGPQAGVNNTTNYYFRTHFTYHASDFVAPLTLWASNAVDDGCVIYLNGMEAGRIRVPANQTAATYASGAIPVAEGTIEPLQISTNWLRVGDNVLAVELHQVSASSVDVAFGLKLAALVPTPIAITAQPVSQTVPQGSSVILGVTTTGGPGAFQWQTNNGMGQFVNIPSATALTYSNTFTVAATNQYRFIAQNGHGSVTSGVATVAVVRDTRGPRVLSATVLEEPTRTNRIELRFDENLFSSGNTSSVASTISPSVLTNNFRLVMSGSNVVVPLTVSTYAPAAAPSTFSRVTLAVTAHAFGTNNWFYGSNYYLQLNNILDLRTNVIAPNTTIAVGWPTNLDLVAADAPWSFHTLAVFEPDIYDQPWQSPGYVEGPLWAQGAGVFSGGLATAAPCLGPFQTETGFQPEPSLFRRPFLWPAGFPAEAQLQFTRSVDDGVIAYVNGVEAFRTNLPAAPAPITGATRALAAGSAVCVTNSVSVSSLVPGLNWLAAAVCQSTTVGDGDMVFGLGLRGTVVNTWTLPPEPSPVLEISPVGPGRFRFAWSGSGYALESADDLSAGTASAPAGPWTEVPQMTNPYTNTFAGPQRFFRLRK